MNKNDKYQKQLTLQDRYVIEDGLNHGESIARRLGKDITTISREVRKHRIGDEGFSVHHNDCRYRMYCQKQSLCTECTKVKKCCSCKIVDCRMLCPDYRSDLCKILFVPLTYVMDVMTFMNVENLIFIIGKIWPMMPIE